MAHKAHIPLETPFDFDSEIFSKEDRRAEDLHLQMSEKYMVYKDLADRCIINPTLVGKFDCFTFITRYEN